MISIIIPTFKPREYIFKCLNSLKKQTLDSSQFEVLIILNGDKEPYFTDLNNFISNYKNFKLFYLEKKGVSNARNLGLDVATGDNIVFIDDDDYISENYLQSLLICKSSEVSIVVSNMKCDEYNKILDDYYSKAFTSLQNTEYNLLKFRKFLSSPCAKLFDTKVISNVRFDTDLKTSEDALFCFHISKNIKHMVLANEDCIYYRLVRVGSASRKKEDFIDLLNEYLLKIKKVNQIYFKDFKQYNFKFYITRILAFTKFLLIKLK